MVAAHRHGKTLIVIAATIALQQRLAADLEAIARLAATPVPTVSVTSSKRGLTASDSIASDILAGPRTKS